jgi:uncharacterized integral membrane protein
MDMNKKVVYTLLLVIALLLLLVIFTLLNTQQIAVKLFFWRIHSSVALVILVPLAIGLLIGWLGIPFIVSLKRRLPKTKEEK